MLSKHGRRHHHPRPTAPATGTTTTMARPSGACLRPLADDRALLSAINHGEFAIHGFRNRDLRAIFFPQTTDDKQQRRRHSAWISRKLRLLRARALITKIVGTPLPANLRRSQDHRGYPQCVTLHSCPAHACGSPTNRGRRIDAMKNLCKRKRFWKLMS